MGIHVNEIFYSIQGETLYAGFPSLFIRLAGCNLNCKYCDTPNAKSRENSKLMSIEEIMGIAANHSFAHHITITGGEPLIQQEVLDLISIFGSLEVLTQVETNGSVSIANSDRRARYIIDIKTPSSGEENSFNFENINALSSQDEVKFVIADENDYDFAKTFIWKHLFPTPAIINFSPVFGVMKEEQLTNLIIKDALTVRLNVQLHKLIGHE